MVKQRRIPATVLALLAAASAHADTFTVTTTADAGAGSLRAAILAANALQVSGGTACAGHRITFDIPGSGVRTIRPTGALPRIDIPIEIDGYSQPGSSQNTLAVGSNAVILIEIDGSLAGNVDAFVLNAVPGGGVICIGSGSRFSGLAINRFAGAAISMGEQICPSGQSCNVGAVRIFGNHIGTDAAGMVALGNGAALGRAALVFGRFSSSNVVGEEVTQNGGSQTPNPALRNVISGNAVDGILLQSDVANGPSQNHRIRNNYIGVDAAGTGLLPNGRHGIHGAPGSSALRIADNVISGNGGDGVVLSDAAPNGSGLDGNAIGATATGLAAGNAGHGVRIVGDGRGHGIVRGYPFIPSGLASIAFNGGSGVRIEGTAIADFLLAPIAGNTALDLDLVPPSGPNANDPLDADGGPNEGLNHPLLTAAEVLTGASTGTLRGTYSGQPNTRHEIYFFRNEACHPSGSGGGQAAVPITQFTSFVAVDTDALGDASFTINNVPLQVGRQMTALARRFSGGVPAALMVSEFSPCRPVVAVTPLIFLDGFEAMVPP